MKNNRKSKKVRLSQHRKKRRFVWHSIKTSTPQVVASSNSDTSISECIEDNSVSLASTSTCKIEEGPTKLHYTGSNDEEGEVENNMSLPSESSQTINSHSSPCSSIYADTSAKSSLVSITLDTESSTILDDNTEDFWVKLSGRRIADMKYVFQQVWEIDKHSPAFDCRISNLKLLNETSQNLSHKWRFQCGMCHEKFIIYSDKSIDPRFSKDSNNSLSVLTAAVSGVIASGNGQTVLDKILSYMEIPPVGTATYTKVSDKVNKSFIKAAEEEMLRAGKKEAELAERFGDVGADGIPHIRVTADGCWSRRSFGTNYASLGGVATIIGMRTQKVLYCGIKNKYCYRCSRAENNKTDSNESGEKGNHICFKNFSGSSTGMEQAAIIEGFQCSLKMHGVRYSHLIADGDSSVYKKLLEANPYGSACRVKKVSCKNHILRCFRRNIDKYCSTTSNKFQPLVNAKRLIRAKRIKLSNAIDAACKSRAAEEDQNASLLRADILNAPHHVFGDHEECAEYYCKKPRPANEINYIPELKEADAYKTLRGLVLRVADESDSLILNENNNKVESFNSVVCKVIAGKRVNYTGSSGYHGRSSLAVLLFNRQLPFRTLHKAECNNNSPGVISTRNENLMLRRRDLARQAKKSSKRRLFGQPDEDYGLAGKKDMLPEIYAEKVEEFMAELELSEEDRQQLEVNTRGQSGNSRWKQERCKRITASNFGNICKKGLKTSTACAVRSIVGNTFVGNKATRYGLEMESKAREKLQLDLDVEIEECGLVIHPTYSYLGASPDGLIGTDMVVEIKCPTTLADKTEAEAEEVISTGGIKWLDFNGDLKKSNNYFFQVQGQLEITDRETSLFVIYGPNYMHVQEIARDRNFWNTKMLPHLISFFHNCLLPELVDSRLARGLSVRAVNYAGAPVESKKKALVQRKKKNESFEHNL